MLKNKLFLLALILTLVLSSTGVFAQNITFSDLGSDHWAYKSVMQMVGKGILEGHEDGTFRPEDSVTREQFAKILVLALDLPLENPATPTFADVAKSDWSYKYVETARDYLTGYSRQDGSISYYGVRPAVREDMAVAIVYARGLQGEMPDYSVLDSFADKNSISNSLKKYIAIAVKNKIMDGDGYNFYPQDSLTRAEACELMYKSGIIAKGEEKVSIGEKLFNGPTANYQSGTYTGPIEVSFKDDPQASKNGFPESSTEYLYTLDGTQPQLSLSDANTKRIRANESIKINQSAILRVMSVWFFGDGAPVYSEVLTYKYVIKNETEISAPAVIGTTPVNGETGVNLTPKIIITFSKPVILNKYLYDGEIIVKDSSGKAVHVGDYLLNGRQFSFTTYVSETKYTVPQKLLPNTKYMVIIPAGEFKDNAGNLSQAYTFSFTTKADTDVPTVIRTTPANEAIEVSSNPTIVMEFNNSISVSSFAKVTIADNNGKIAYEGKPTLGTGNTIITSPTLKAGTRYTLTLNAGSVLGGTLLGNKAYYFSFTTKAEDGLPVPANLKASLTSNKKVSLTWSAVSGVTGYDIYRDNFHLAALDGATQNSFTDIAVESGKTYTYKICSYHAVNQSKASNGVSITIPAATAPKVISTTPANGATNVTSAITIKLTFSEPICDVATSMVSVTDQDGNKYSSIQASHDNTTNTISIKYQLNPSKKYTVVVQKGFLGDYDGNPNEAYTFSFTTVGALIDKIAVTDRSPLPFASGVSVDTPITVTFNNDITAGSGAITGANGIKLTKGATTTNALATITPNSSSTAVALHDMMNNTFLTGRLTLNQDGKKITIMPDVSLKSNTVYYIELGGGLTTNDNPTGADTTLATMIEANPLLSRTFMFKTVTSATAPTVVSTTPVSGSTNVDKYSTIAVTFSENIVSSDSFNSISAVLTQGQTSYGLTDTISGKVLTIRFNMGYMPEGQGITVTIPANSVKNSSGKGNDAYTFNFTTASDATVPTVVSTSPSNGATNIEVNPNIVISFSKIINISNVAKVTVKDNSGNVAYEGKPIFSTVNNSSITIRPTLNAGTKYTVTLAWGSVVDNAAHPNAEYTFNFTTATAPKVVSTSIANGATNVSLNPDIKITFSEPIRGFTEWSMPKLYVGNNEWTNGLGMSEWKNDGYVIMNIRNLDPGVKYTVKIENTYKNIAGVIVAPYTFSFTTVAAPTVVSTSPANGATNVAVNTPIVITSSGLIAQSEIMSSEIKDETGKSYTYSKVNNGNAVTLTLYDNMIAGMKYTVILNKGFIKDAAGNSSEAYTFSFTTAAADAIKVASTSPENGETVSGNSPIITIFFTGQVSATSNIRLTIKDSNGNTARDGSVTVAEGDPSAISIRPILESGKTYTVTLAANSVVDSAGTTNEAYTFSFTTDATNTIKVVSTSIANGATNVPINTSLTIEYSEVFTTSTSIWGVTTFYEVTNPSEGQAPDGILIGNKLTYPTLNFESGKTYVFEVKGPGNNTNDKTVESCKITFTTAATSNDIEAPTVKNASLRTDFGSEVILSNTAFDVDSTKTLLFGFNFSEAIATVDNDGIYATSKYDINLSDNIESAQKYFEDGKSIVIVEVSNDLVVNSAALGITASQSSDYKTLYIAIPAGKLAAGRSYQIQFAAKNGNPTGSASTAHAICDRTNYTPGDDSKVVNRMTDCYKFYFTTAE